MSAAFMKELILIAGLLIAGFSTTSFADDPEARPDVIDMSVPPFWMFSYEEFSDMQQAQKDFYLEKFVPLAAKVPGLEKISKEKMKDATEWFQSWNILRRKIYESCKDPALSKTCESLADVRVDALNLFANQKQENRHADREAEKEKKKKKSTSL